MDWNFYEMTPQEYLSLTSCKYKEMADICDRTPSYVGRWFMNPNSQHWIKPTKRDMRLLYFAYHEQYKTIKVNNAYRNQQQYQI